MEARVERYHDKQIMAIDALSIESDVLQVLYGGAASSGKSFLGCDWQIIRRIKYPGTRGLIGRAELKKLRLSTMKTFFELCNGYGLQAGKHYTYNGQDHVITWWNGSETILMDLAYMPSDPDYQRFGSIEITDYFIDEAAEIESRCLDIVHSRCRYQLPSGKQKGLLTCNPSTGWIFNDFYLLNKNNQLPAHRAFIQALPTDNPYIDPAYLRGLELMNEYDKQRLLYGNWEYSEDADKLFFNSDIAAMFRQEPKDDKAIRYITADVARFGADKTVIMLWEGLSVKQITALEKRGIDETIETIREIRNTHNVQLKNIIVDEDGIGGGVVDALKCTGFINHSKAVENTKYVSIKHECYFKLASYIAAGKINIEGANNEIKQRITKEIEAVKRHNSDKDTRLCVTPKDEIKRRNGFSPDFADCLMMRMYFELHPNRGNYMMIGIN